MRFREFIKQNFALFCGIALPILLVALFFAVSVLPRMITPAPQHKLLLSTSDYSCRSGGQFYIEKYSVRDGRVVMTVDKNDDKGSCKGGEKLFVYDPAKQTTREIQIRIPEQAGKELVVEETKKFTVDPSEQSPDGYVFSIDDYNGGGVAVDVFGGSRNRGHARITKGKAAYKVPRADGRHYFEMPPLGWVTAEKAP